MNRVIALVLLLLFVAGLGAAVLWANSGQLRSPSPTTVAEQVIRLPQAPASPSEVNNSDDTAQTLNALQQSVKELQATQQQMAAQLELVDRQLKREQGERQLMSEQIGALSGRVDSQSTSSPSRSPSSKSAR